jgi:hypothetical protein
LPWIRRRFSVDAADRVVIALRLAQTAGLLVGLALLMDFRSVGAIFSYVAPLIWTWVVPLRGAESSRPTHAARGLVATALLAQYLHAYPIGGSQESWGTFLFIPLVAMGLAEIRAWCTARSTGPWVARRAGPTLARLVLLVVVVKSSWTAVAMHRRYAARDDLRLPGAGKLRLTEDLSSAYRLLALNAAVHGDVLFSLPGMFSFNLWTDLPTPTEKNTTLWFTLLNDAEQSAIIASLQRSPRACVIVQQSLVQLMQASKVPMHGILHVFLQENFSPAFQIEGFSFMVRNGRTIAPIGIAHLGLQATASSPSPDTRLDVCLESDGTPIAAIEACALTAPKSLLFTLNSTDTQTVLATVNRANQLSSPPTAVAWPLRFKGLARVSLRFNRAGIRLAPGNVVFHLKGVDGRRLGEIRIHD